MGVTSPSQKVRVVDESLQNKSCSQKPRVMRMRIPIGVLHSWKIDKIILKVLYTYWQRSFPKMFCHPVESHTGPGGREFHCSTQLQFSSQPSSWLNDRKPQLDDCCGLYYTHPHRPTRVLEHLVHVQCLHLPSPLVRPHSLWNMSSHVFHRIVLKYSTNRGHHRL